MDPRWRVFSTITVFEVSGWELQYFATIGINMFLVSYSRKLFRAAAPLLGGQTTWNLSGVSRKRDCSFALEGSIITLLLRGTIVNRTKYC